MYNNQEETKRLLGVHSCPFYPLKTLIQLCGHGEVCQGEPGWCMIPSALHSSGWGSHILQNAHWKVRGDSPSTAN